LKITKPAGVLLAGFLFAANDVTLLKAGGIFSPLPIAVSRSAQLGGTLVTIGFVKQFG
jgi:hypothetical protein